MYGSIKKVTAEEIGLTNYAAYCANFKPLDFYRVDKREIRAVPAGESDEKYIQAGTADYINGWLYGAVQTVCGQHRPLMEKKCGYLVSVALHNNAEGEDLVNFLYTGDKVLSDKFTAKAHLCHIMEEAMEQDDHLREAVFSWADFLYEGVDYLEKAGYARLWDSCDSTIQLKGIITLGLACDISIM